MPFIAAAAALALVAPAGAATPDQLLDTGTIVPETTPDRPAATKTSLEEGKTYRLVLTGTWTVQWPGGSVADEQWFDYDEQDDALYCVKQDPPPRPDQPCTNPYSHRWGGVAVGIGDYNAFADNSIRGLTDSAPPPASADDRYDITFTALHSGTLRFWDPYAGDYGTSGYPDSASGSFDFQLYGAGGSGSGGGTKTPGSGGGGKVVGTGHFYVLQGGQVFQGRKFVIVAGCDAACAITERVSFRVGSAPVGGGSGRVTFPAGKYFRIGIQVPKKTWAALVRGAKAHRKLFITVRLAVTSGGATHNSVWRLSGST